VLSAGVDRSALHPAARWELELNTFKTYPCGVVAHPAMDAAIIASARIDTAAVRSQAATDTGPGKSPPVEPPTARHVVCAAAGLVESRLAGRADPGGWSLPAVSALIGAGLAAGLMLGLTPAQLRFTLGICATQAAGLHGADSTDAGPVQAGKAAFNAVEAAVLASLGFTSSGEPLDGRRALFALFGA
jgi:2-methylcitrate dehydratase PrpD